MHIMLHANVIALVNPPARGPLITLLPWSACPYENLYERQIIVLDCRLVALIS